MPVLVEVVAALLSLLAAGSAGEAFRKTVEEMLKIRKQLTAAREESFHKTLQSADIQVVGRYLDDVIGNFTVRQYARNKTVAGRVENYLDRLAEFLAPEAEVEERPAMQERPASDNLSAIARTVLEQSPWNVLAALRREVEIRLRELASRHDLAARNHIGAGALLNVLHRAGYIPDTSYSDLKYSINVANRGVHGETVSADEVSEVLFLAQRAMDQLEMPLPQPLERMLYPDADAPLKRH